MYICLYDKKFQALGAKKTYHCSSWSLKRCAYEMDSFTATTEEISGSGSAVYVALFEDEGALKYLAFSGRPKTEDGVTKVVAMDLRRIFLQELYIEYANYQTSPTVAGWVSYLLGRPIAAAGGYLGVAYSIDVSEFATNPPAWVSASIPSASDKADLWAELQSAMMRYGFVIVAEGEVTTNADTKKTEGTIAFKAKLLSGTFPIKLADFDQARVVDDSTDANRALARSTDGASSSEYWIFNLSDGSESVLEKSAGLALIDDDFAKACSDAQDAMLKNRYKGSVTLDLGLPAGKSLRESMTVYSQGLIYGYNSADDSTVKLLPTMWVSEDSSGAKKCCFGRLDDYFYL
jgi:hypothetical protein